MSKRQIREKGDRENDGSDPERRGRMEIKCATLWKNLSIIEQSIGQRGNLQTMKRQGAKCMTLKGKENGIE